MITSQKMLGLGLALSLLGTGCAAQNTEKTPLDAQHPTTVVLWNYYNGQTKIAFDELVAQFNETVGMEQGIVVDPVSYGDVQLLANAVYEAATFTLGAEEMPDIFGGYPDNVYRVDQVGAVADMSAYFTAEELGAYRQDFLLDCYLGEGNALKVIPVARSTDILYLNRTDWEPFAQATGAETSDLATWEGVAQTAEAYYNWTDAQTPETGDGKAFFGMDSFANYIIAASMQQRCAVYDVEGHSVEFRFEKDFAKKLWDSVYVPYLKGHYANYGLFRSDDAKTGDVLAYIGSSAGAQYFPMEVMDGQDKSYAIESLTLPYPCFAGAERYAIAQGAGFAIAKKDEAHEYASSIFLKWFTDPKQNTKFAVASGYLPVESAALAQDLAAESAQFNETYLNTPTVAQSIATTHTMLTDFNLYANQPFNGSYDLRQLMEKSLIGRINQDLEQVERQVQAGTSRQEAVAVMTDDEGFVRWYQDFLSAANEILAQ